ncbi:hypothetical protein [Thiocystis violacea]|uniref:hypothetical protein n=1 Tax=Thiocystis violacea TaxID=13725 RepID=UPI001905AC64|nr:hypothetical protein [Thiocystis violacea]MBK1722196.1 hypothetical protein [Thiocystis violacea]
MSKKQKRRVAGAGHRSSPLTPDALANQARTELDAGRFRDAIASFKQLLKQEARPEWRDALADAYAGRAGELTEKGMLKEAMVMWDNREALGPDVPPAADHAALLLRLGRFDACLDRLAKAEEMRPADRERLRGLIAARVLADKSDTLDRLPADDSVRRQAGAARAALNAYCAGDEPAVRAALGEIPFRSPYRDLAQILKALQLLPERPAEAAKLLGRIAPDSGFRVLKEAAELALLPESAFLTQALKAGRSKARFACMLRGWPQERIAFLDELRPLGAGVTADVFLRFLHKHRAQLGEDWARQKGLRLLVQHYPSSLQWLPSIGAPPASPREALLIRCWATEQTDAAWEITDTWGLLAERLRLDYRQEDANPTQRLSVALVMRRADRIADVLCADPSASDAPPEEEDVTAERVEQSLEWDPDDCDTYLRLIAFHRGRGRAKDVRRLLAAASERWPDDMRVLNATMEAAIDSGAFKKATTLARRILAIDPINSGVRDRLVEAHLAHARKQMFNFRPDLASKELEAAQEWARGEHAREQLDILSGLNRLTQDESAGLAQLRALAERLGSGLTAQVVLTLAGDPVRWRPLKLFKQLALHKVLKPDPRDLIGALARLKQYLDGRGTLSIKVRDALAKFLAKVDWSKLARGDMESACETLKRAKLDAARDKAARAALKRWRGAPLFQLHAFEAKYPHGCSNTYGQDFFDLEIALNRARSEGDTRTALRIQDVISQSVGPFGRFSNPFDLPPLDDEPDFPPELDLGAKDALVALIELVGLDKALELSNAPPAIRRELKTAARESGEEAIIDMLIAMFEELESRIDFDGLPMPPPSPPKGNRRTPKPKAAKKPNDEDPPMPEDLFS